MTLYKTIYSCLILLSFTGESMAQKQVIDVQGHRGCRGVMPENSIPAFIKAIEMGVNTLELDVVISRDQQVVVSHEPWINAAICLNLDGTKLKLKKENQLNMYQMNYDEIKQYDCGTVYYDRFPQQQKINTIKPLLKAVFDTVKSYCKQHKLALPAFNIEIKSEVQFDSVYAPAPAAFCELVMKEINENQMRAQCIIQSFDVRVLKYMHQKYPAMPLSFLSEEIADFKTIKEKLGFLPPVFSPYHVKVTQDLIAKCHQNQIKIIPWTVNDYEDIKKLIQWRVDGIISDYPQKVIRLL